MKTHTPIFLICLSFLISGVLFFSSPASAYDVTMAWDSNTEPNLRGYKLYSRAGNSRPPYDNIGTYPEEDLVDPLNPMVKITDLEQDVTYYFAVRAYDPVGNESGDSNVIWVRNGEWGNVQSAKSDIGSSSSGGGGGGACFIANAKAGFSLRSLLSFLSSIWK